MADQIVTRQDLVDAHYDAETLGECINGEENTEVTSRLGRTYWTLATINYLISQGQLKISDLQAAIDIAAAAGAGENGWIDTLVLTLTGENLREFNKKTISTLDCIDDLATTLPWPGRTVNVRSVIKDKHLGGGTFVFSADSSKVPDGYIVVAANGGNWVKITVAFPTIDDFGGLGDDPNYDDADAFIRCALSPYTGSNIYLANRQVEYRINKQVDCKGKGIVGGGFSRQNATAYAMNSLKVRPGDYSNSNTLLNNVAFINVGAEVRDLQLVSEGVSENISGLKVDGYNFTLSNANISGFYNQVYLSNATVSFRVQNLMSISASNAGFYIADVDSKQSTTAYFDNCSWQWGKYPVLFAKEAYQCVFNNIILEYMQYGLTAGIWSNCSFNAIWAEQTRDGVARDWLVNTSYQQTFNCITNNLYIRTPWLNRADTTALAVSDNIGGVVIDKSRITLSGATGAKIQLSPSGLATLFANWYGGTNRRLLITTQPTAADSGYKTPIHINAPNSELYFGNQDETSVASVVFKRVIGATAANTPYIASDSWTKKIRKWNTYNHEVSKVGRFIAPMMLTYDVNFTTQQNNAGWSISKESTGVYRLQRDAGVTTELANPHIFVSGIFSGTGLGDGKAILPPTLQAIEAYSGSWSSYKVAAGVKLFFIDLTGALVDPMRFSVSFTLESGI
ncbi:hypothetical protein [Acinetobacter baumannii]|uniref:hypothetical protein n=1 Tax=Acinetobacter baumannii TaxID=470 RepID=UPI00215E74E8|nr:hypothetical protein [Acinetobacter baumannii]